MHDENGNARLELVKERNTDIMKKIIKNHLGANNIIISDGWEAYSWLWYDNYEHRVYIHVRHDFGWGSESIDI